MFTGINHPTFFPSAISGGPVKPDGGPSRLPTPERTMLQAGTLAAPGIAVVAFGAATGGLIGGITVAREESQNGGSADFWDVVLGATIGAAVGGWAAYATVYGHAGYGKVTGEGLGDTIFGNNNVLSGALNNLITQEAAGFAHAIAQPIARHGGLDPWDLLSAAVSGVVSGAVQGALFGGFNTLDLGIAENAGGGTALDVWAGYLATTLTVLSY
jgi:hypothetical protein